MVTVDKWKVIAYIVRLAMAMALSALAVYYIFLGQPTGSYFSPSVIAVLLPAAFSTDLYVGATVNKVINNMVGTAVGSSLGYVLRLIGDDLINNQYYAVILYSVIYVLVSAGVSYIQFIDWVKKYDICVDKPFLLAFAGVLFIPQAPIGLADMFFNKAVAFLCSLAFTILLSLLSNNIWAGVCIHDSIREYIDTLGSAFKELAVAGFEENHANQSVKDLIDSKEKENSLIKSIRWEWPWRHIEENCKEIGDHSRHCAITIQPLFDRTQLGETSKDICSKLGNILEDLSLSIKSKTIPDSIVTHLKCVKNDILHRSRLLEAGIAPEIPLAVDIIIKLADSITKLASLMQYKQSGLENLNVSSTEQLVPSEDVVESDHVTIIIEKKIETTTN